MILAIDAGNTNIKFGFMSGQHVIHSFKVSTDHGKTSDEYWFYLQSFSQMISLPLDQIEGVSICSVVPSLDPVFLALVKRYIKKKWLFVEPGIKTGMTVAVENAKELGADIVAGAVGAMHAYGLPAIVLSFGTATVLTAISSKKEILGVSIAPGMVNSSESLFSKTSKLPRIDLRQPESFIGRSTVQSMQSGFFFGFLGMINYLIEGISVEMEDVKPHVIATGGLCSLMAGSLKKIDFMDPYLNLKGLSLLYEKNMVDTSAAL
jgi:type III pantothenate kinase